MGVFKQRAVMLNDVMALPVGDNSEGKSDDNPIKIPWVSVSTFEYVNDLLWGRL